MRYVERRKSKSTPWRKEFRGLRGRLAGVRAGDPRPSIAERYSGREYYLSRNEKAIDELVKERWVLDEDRAALLRRGGAEWNEATK
jgi:hypothetical protein